MDSRGKCDDSPPKYCSGWGEGEEESVTLLSHPTIAKDVNLCVRKSSTMTMKILIYYLYNAS